MTDSLLIELIQTNSNIYNGLKMVSAEIIIVIFIIVMYIRKK